MTMYVFMEKYEINQVIVVEEVSDQERYLRRIHLSRAQHFHKTICAPSEDSDQPIMQECCIKYFKEMYALDIC